MIDLQSFCANQWETRSYLQRPWRDGEWVYATNGHMIVRVPFASAPEVEPRAPNQPKNPPDMFRKWLGAETGDFLLMPPLPDDAKCVMCDGTGEWKFHPDEDADECPHCFGTKHAFVAFELGDAEFNQHYLHQLAAIPQCRIRTHGDKNPAAAIFDGGQALLMPMRKKGAAA